MLITKASGEQEPFVRKKYEDSLKRVGLTIKEAREISSQIHQDLYPKITSGKIYTKTHQILKKKNKIFAAKYSLKRAIMDLGPSGYFFERYVAGVLAAYGYAAKYNQFMRGTCVEHEVDIVAQKNGQKFMIECKYHNKPGRKSDLKVALYVYARYLDLKDKHRFNEAALITNTGCTSEAVKYAKCVGLKIIAWRYPAGRENLEYFIESKKLYPVTVLTTLNSNLNRQFRKSNIVLASDLLKLTPKSLSKRFHIKEDLAKRLIGEAEVLVK